MSNITPLSQVGAVDSLRALDQVDAPSQEGLTDVFSQKVGGWAFASSAPSVHNVQPDVPNRFSSAPPDSIIMEYVEDFVAQMGALPVGHLYDSALEQVASKVTNPAVAEILNKDLDLRFFLRQRRIGEVYE